MIEVEITAVAISPVFQMSLAVLTEIDTGRCLLVSVSPEIAEDIQRVVRNIPTPRPLSHDLITTIIAALGGQVSHVAINGLDHNRFQAQIVLDVKGRGHTLEARASDGLALAIRTGARIFVADEVMAVAGMQTETRAGEAEEEHLEAFEDLIDTLDLEGL